MIRTAVLSDLPGIDASYRMHFRHEEEHGAFTLFREGVYPTAAVARDAIGRGALAAYESGGEILGSIICDGEQPEEYAAVAWPSGAPGDRVRVIHLLLVRPDAAGRGIGTALIAHAEETARREGCVALRLDTGMQNVPARSLYEKVGFRIASTGAMRIGGVIPHDEHLFFEKPL